MKVLHINTSDHTGGAAIAALRLIRALRKEGVDAKLLCRDRTLPVERTEIVNLPPTRWRQTKFVLDRLEIFIRNGFSRKGLFAVDTARMGNNIVQMPEFRKADVIHLHWTNQGMLSLHDIRTILASGKKVVWTMHDMWPFTGICHHAKECKGWLKGCGNCPQLRFPHHGDVSASVYRKKKKVYDAGKITFVGCSRWLAELAAQSPLLAGQNVVSISNPIDTDFYHPAGTNGSGTREEIRCTLGLPTDKLLIFFAAYKATDPGKGIDSLMAAINILQDEKPELAKKLGIVIAGREAETLVDQFAVPVYPIGYVTDEKQMLHLYQATDVLAMPTRMDNLPNTIMEAAACALPCVAFAVGGVPQMVENGVNGCLAPANDDRKFAQGLAQVLSTQSHAALTRNARTKAVQTYSEKTIAKKFIELYK